MQDGGMLALETFYSLWETFTRDTLGRWTVAREQGLAS